MKLCPNIEICFICDKEEQTSSIDWISGMTQWSAFQF